MVSLSNPLVPVAHAQAATSTPLDPLQAQIDQSNNDIAQLKQEIAQLQTQLTATSKPKQTLQSAVVALNLNMFPDTRDPLDGTSALVAWDPVKQK